MDVSVVAPSITFGPNSQPAVGQVPGCWRGATLSYQIISPEGIVGPKVFGTNNTYIDSGGLGRQLSSTALPSDLKGSTTLPRGSMINVFTPDGQQLLHQTEVIRSDSCGETVVDDSDPTYMNTGMAPFPQGPIYFDYSGTGNVVWDYLPQ